MLQSKNFDGATAKRLGHHGLPILKKDKPDSVLIHIGTNDVNNHNLYAVSPEKLASDIIEIGRTCKRQISSRSAVPANVGMK